MYTYSFSDTKVTINSGQVFGLYTAYGNGLGDITISMANDVTSHDVSTDLSVVVSKHAYRHGTVSFSVLKATDFDKWLEAYYNQIVEESTSKFATTTITIKNITTGDTYLCEGVSPQKRPDSSYQAQAQTRTWVFMCASITNGGAIINRNY